jgi:hypothetical protein
MRTVNEVIDDVLEVKEKSWVMGALMFAMKNKQKNYKNNANFDHHHKIVNQSKNFILY